MFRLTFFCFHSNTFFYLKWQQILVKLMTKWQYMRGFCLFFILLASNACCNDKFSKKKTCELLVKLLIPFVEWRWKRSEIFYNVEKLSLEPFCFDLIDKWNNMQIGFENLDIHSKICFNCFLPHPVCNVYSILAKYTFRLSKIDLCIGSTSNNVLECCYSYWISMI